MATELRELTDVRRSCRDASESEGEGCDSTGETWLVCVVSVGEGARRLEGEVADMWPGTGSVDTVVKGANGADIAGRKTPCPIEWARNSGWGRRGCAEELLTEFVDGGRVIDCRLSVSGDRRGGECVSERALGTGGSADGDCATSTGSGRAMWCCGGSRTWGAV